MLLHVQMQTYVEKKRENCKLGPWREDSIWATELTGRKSAVSAYIPQPIVLRLSSKANNRLEGGQLPISVLF